MEKFALIFIATTLLLSNFTGARSRWTLRDVLPPNFLGKVSYFHRPWYGRRREAELPKKVFENAPQNFLVIEIAEKLMKSDIKKLFVFNKVMPKQDIFLQLVCSIKSTSDNRQALV